MGCWVVGLLGGWVVGGVVEAYIALWISDPTYVVRGVERSDVRQRAPAKGPRPDRRRRADLRNAREVSAGGQAVKLSTRVVAAVNAPHRHESGRVDDGCSNSRRASGCDYGVAKI